MTGYADYEESRASGGPVQCYLFRYGLEAGEYYAYTSHTDDVTIAHGSPLGDITYEPVPIQRDNIQSNGTLDRSALKVMMDVGTELAELLRVYPPSSVITMTIFEGHIDDPDEEFSVTWAGRIVAGGREHSEFGVSGEPVSTSMRRPGLRRNYQYGCPHALYGPECRADKGAATVTGTVDTITGNEVGLLPSWEGAFNRLNFVRGTLEWTPVGSSTERRMIVRVVGDILHISGNPKALEVGDTVNVVLGCNHKAYAEDGGDCDPLHNNIVNYGGQRWIPIKNVVNTNPYY